MRALLCLAIAVVCPLIAAEKQLKPGESEIYNAVIQDLTASSLGKAVTDLDTWSQKFPDSDFKDDRAALYVQTYVLSNQFAKAVDTAGPLVAKDLNAVFTDPQGPLTTIRLLYNVVAAISQLPNPTPGEIVTATKAAHQLMDYDRPLPGVDPAKWTEARNDMRAKASGALLYMEILPGIQAMAKTPPDCAGAEDVYRRAVTDYPDRAALSYELGRALNCEARVHPEKQAAAIYEFVRAATIDPTLGDPRNDRKRSRPLRTMRISRSTAATKASIVFETRRVRRPFPRRVSRSEQRPKSPQSMMRNSKSSIRNWRYGRGLRVF